MDKKLAIAIAKTARIDLESRIRDLCPSRKVHHAIMVQIDDLIKLEKNKACHYCSKSVGGRSSLFPEL